MVVSRWKKTKHKRIELFISKTIKMYTEVESVFQSILQRGFTFSTN